MADNKNRQPKTRQKGGEGKTAKPQENYHWERNEIWGWEQKTRPKEKGVTH